MVTLDGSATQVVERPDGAAHYARAVLTPQTLLIDADDTLWANNIYFEQVTSDYLHWLAHPTLQHTEIRQILDDIERANVHTAGFGSLAFLQNLRECFQVLMRRPIADGEASEIDAMATALLEHRIDLYDGVVDTLGELGLRHDLKLVTKGHVAEQQRKIDASELAPYFSSTHIVPTKQAHTYRDLVAELSLDVSATWMIGNSPASDINPAREAGLRAVFIPNPDTWVLEHATVDPYDAGILTLHRFSDLATVF